MERVFPVIMEELKRKHFPGIVDVVDFEYGSPGSRIIVHWVENRPPTSNTPSWPDSSEPDSVALFSVPLGSDLRKMKPEALKGLLKREFERRFGA